MKGKVFDWAIAQGYPSLPGGIAGASLKAPRVMPQLDVDEGALPGGIAGASLKAGNEAAGGPGASALPGGIAGASLKEGALERRHDGKLRPSPRRNRRGLIEGPPRRAAACRVDCCSPRRNRRGLIEGRRRRSALRRGRGSLPGGIAGASLKEQAGIVMDELVGSLPGGIAGASLKGARLRREEERPEGSPRRNRRGLIEGRRPISISSSTSSLSPAESPGPH